MDPLRSFFVNPHWAVGSGLSDRDRSLSGQRSWIALVAAAVPRSDHLWFPLLSSSRSCVSSRGERGDSLAALSALSPGSGDLDKL